MPTPTDPQLVDDARREIRDAAVGAFDTVVRLARMLTDLAPDASRKLYDAAAHINIAAEMADDVLIMMELTAEHANDDPAMLGWGADRDESKDTYGYGR